MCVQTLIVIYIHVWFEVNFDEVSSTYRMCSAGILIFHSLFCSQLFCLLLIDLATHSMTAESNFSTRNYDKLSQPWFCQLYFVQLFLICYIMLCLLKSPGMSVCSPILHKYATEITDKLILIIQCYKINTPNICANLKL